MLLLLCVGCAVLPLAGIVFVVLNGMLATVDGLFMGPIPVLISGVFLLNAALELRRRKAARAPAQTQKAAAQKAS